MSPTPAERNLAAEVRAVEDGHHAFVVNGTTIEVVSDTHQGKRYAVELGVTVDGALVFSCKPARGSRLYEDDHRAVVSSDAGVVCCKHAAVAARRLERERLAALVEGRWVSTAPRAVDTSDPFAGFPR